MVSPRSGDVAGAAGVPAGVPAAPGLASALGRVPAPASAPGPVGTGTRRLLPLAPLRCEAFEAGRCGSCTLIRTPLSEQLAAKEAVARAALAGTGLDAASSGVSAPSGHQSVRFLPTVSAGDRGFRNRAKLAVGGETGRVTLGILGPDGRGVDLQDCAIHSPGIARELPAIAAVLNRTRLAPYNVPERRGELKYVHVTEAPDEGELMLRFVVRSEAGLDRLRGGIGELLRAVPRAAVVSVNLLPEHRAVLEGEREVTLVGESLAMRMGKVTLHLLPRSFFQTNTAVARELLAQVADWAERLAPASLWDLYCGVGGFALHCAARLRPTAPAAERPPAVVGVESTEAAVRSARRSAREAGLRARFVAADATAFALAEPTRRHPELAIVNPPRRGIGPELAGWFERSRVGHVVYSSCNPESLARDLALMPSYRPLEARVFDMFPHTRHVELAVLLRREG